MASAAVVITARNERDLLRANILYHRYLGISLFYVFLDETTDDTKSTVDDLNFVVISESASATGFLDSQSHREMVLRSESLQRAIEKSGRHHTARQMLNTFVALEDAHERGIEWLIPIDADELVCLSLDRAEPGQLATFFDTVESGAEQIRFRPLEIVQQNRHYQNVFAEGTVFKRPDSTVSRPVYDPFQKIIRKFELNSTRFWKLRFPTFQRFTWWYGHHEGKCAVRVNLGIVPRIHHFEDFDGRELITKEYGYLLHYLMYNVEDFVKKYRNFEKRPDKFLYGMKIPYRKRLWRDIVNNSSFSEDYIFKYYDRWIAFTDEEIGRLQEPDQSKIISVRAVHDVFEEVLEEA